MTPLASINFADPLMLIGLLAAGIPIVLHLLNRIRSPIVEFPTLRFLRITAQKTSRRRQLQHWLLLLLRMAVFAFIAMAIALPLIRGGSALLAYGFIGLLVLGAALLVLAAVLLSAALERAKVPASATATLNSTAAEILNRPAASRASPALVRAFSFSGLIALLGLLGAGYAAYALTSDRYFSGAQGRYTGQSTACVIIYDNSFSMLARQDSASRLQRARDQIRLLLTGSTIPAELALLASNPGANPIPNRLTTDSTAVLGQLERLTPIGKAIPMRQLVHEAVQLLGTSNQPNKLLLILSDMARPAFSDTEVFAPLAEFKDQPALQVALMPQGAGSPPADVGITAFTLAAGQPVIGTEVLFEAQIINNGNGDTVADLDLLVDDQVVPGVHPRVHLGTGGTGGARSNIKIPYRLAAAGLHRFALRLQDRTDAMAWDDQRQLVLNVANQVRVLVLGPEEKIRPRSTAAFIHLALDPYQGSGRSGTGPSAVPTWAIAPTYRSVSQNNGASLAGYAAVFLCDVPQIPPPLADSLLKYVQGGGRAVFVLGSSVDPVSYNAELSQQRQLLPADLGVPVVSATGTTVDWVNVSSALFANLFDNQEPFRAIVVTGRWTFGGAAPFRAQVLSKTADGAPFMTQQLLGRGEVYTVLSAPSAAWSNLATTVAFLPMVSRMALGDSGRLRSETAYEPGNQVFIPVPSNDPKLTIDVLTPANETINLAAAPGSSPPSWSFLQTQHDGIYTWRTPDGRLTGQFVVNPPAEEADLVPVDTDALAKEITLPRPALVAPTTPDLLEQLNKQAEGTSLAPGVFAFVLILAILEALLANRHQPAARTAALVARPASPAPPAPVAPAHSAAA